MKALLTLAASAVIGLSASAIAADFAPAVIYDTAGKFDKSFNEDVFRNGAEQFVKDKGIQVREFEPQNEEQREQGLRRLASRGQSPIFAVGFSAGARVCTSTRTHTHAHTHARAHTHTHTHIRRGDFARFRRYGCAGVRHVA